jgi:hypothetical protein
VGVGRRRGCDRWLGRVGSGMCGEMEAKSLFVDE